MEGFKKNVILSYDRYRILKNAWEKQNGLAERNDLTEGETQEQNDKNRLDPQVIIKMVPKRLRNKCERILESISQSPDLTWDQQGHVTIYGHFFSQSNLCDLINYAINPIQSFIPQGGSDFIQLLLANNVPLSLLSKNHRESIKGGSKPSTVSKPPGIPAKIKYRDLAAEWSWDP